MRRNPSSTRPPTIAAAKGCSYTREIFILSKRKKCCNFAKSIRFDIQSGNHTLQMEGDTTAIIDKTNWQGTVVYMQMQTDKEIDPSKVVANRTNVADQYNETFLTNNELDELW